MPDVHSIDLTTVLLLAAVLWLDGWRRLPRESLVLRRTGVGRWAVVSPWARIGALALVALWPPSGMPFVVATADAEQGDARLRWPRDFAVAVARGRRRLRRTRLQVAALRLVGTLLIAWIVVGIPVATARSGVRGLLLGIFGAFCLSTWLALVTGDTLRALGVSWRAALRGSAPLLSPFAAMRAPELVIESALAGVSSLARVAALLEPDDFDRWLRPYAYDSVHGDAPDGAPTGVALLVSRLPRAVLARAVAPPHDADRQAADAWCPRCTTRYQRDTRECTNCAGVALRQPEPATMTAGRAPA